MNSERERRKEREKVRVYKGENGKCFRVSSVTKRAANASSN
jgi:hypothetical protein